MALIVSHEEVKHKRFERKVHDGSVWRTDFMRPPSSSQVGKPVAFLAESSPHRVQETHYHVVEQFQVVVSGGGTIGRHQLQLLDVHYSRAFTPYAIVADERGCGFLTLRPDFDTGAQKLPEAKDALLSARTNEPWQATEQPRFMDTDSVAIYTFEHIKNDQGLAAYSIRLAPGATTVAADPSTGGGQFIVVTKGSLIHQDRNFDEISIGWVGPDEPAMVLTAGSNGADVLVLCHPRGAKSIVPAGYSSQKVNTPSHHAYRCDLCGYVYDEAKGRAEDGLAPGTSWDDVPQDWTCPECVAEKSDFSRIR